MGIDEKDCTEHETEPLSSERVRELLRAVPGWSLKDSAITCEFQFENFKEAMAFVNNVASIAETEDHHPDIFISYSRVRVTLSTHKIDALSCKDFILAAKIDGLL